MTKLSLIGVAAVTLATSLFSQSVRLEPAPSGMQVVVDTTSGSTVLWTSGDPIFDLTVRAVPGTPAFAVTWRSVDEASLFAMSVVSPDGIRFSDARRIDGRLLLRAGAFDPSFERLEVPGLLRADVSNQLWVVQLWTPWVEAYQQFFEAVGVEALSPLHVNGRIVRGSAAAMNYLMSQSCVRAVTPYHPLYRLDPELGREVLTGISATPTRTLNILAFHPGFAGSARLALEIQRLGGEVVSRDPLTYLTIARLPVTALADLLRHSDVAWIDPWSAPENDMDIARDLHGALYIEGVAGFDGTGVRGEVLDGGTDAAHPEFVPAPIQHGVVPNGNHGTCTYGQIFADGTNPQARGLLHNGTGIAGFYSSFSGGSRSTHTAELVNAAGPYRAVFQSNSWGSTLTTAYNATSAEMDTILFQNDLLLLNSQSNAGSRNSRPQAWAKNVLSVGGVKHANTLSKADDNWTGGASIGPADDGRYKPEIASFYDNIFCSDQVGAAGYNNASDYTTTFGGTSGATPICSGLSGLFFQMWHQGIFGNPTGADVFASKPKATLAKAFIINTATPWNWLAGGPNGDITRAVQGFGHPNVQTIYDNRTKFYWVNETEVLAPFASAQYAVTIAPGESVLHVTMNYIDRSGTTSATLHRINNLNLEVTSPSGAVYHGNNGLLGSLVSTPGGVPNNVDTVENVIVPNPQVGVWTVRVHAAEVNQDGHIETPALDVDYALVIRGGTTQDSSFRFEFSTTPGTGSLHLGLRNLPATATEGWSLFSNATMLGLGSGPLLGLTPDALTFSCFLSPSFAGSPIHYPLPAAGVYPAVAFDLPAGSLAFPVGSQTDGTTLVRLTNGSYATSDIIRVTW